MRKVFTMDEVLHLPLEPMCVDDTVGPLLQNAAQVTNRLIGDRFPRTEPNDPYRPHPRRGRALRRRSQNGPGAGLVCVGAIWETSLWRPATFGCEPITLGLPALFSFAHTREMNLWP